VAACHAWSVETPAGPQPGSPAQRGNRPVRPAARAPAWSPRADRPWDGAVARRWQGVVRDLEGVTGKASGKEERTRVHRNGGSTVRRCKRCRAAVFFGGEGLRWVATVGVGSCSTGEARGGEKIARNCRDWQLGKELTEEWRTAAVLGRNPQGRRGCRWPKAAVRVRGAVGKLERSREGVGEEWGWGDEWSSASGERATRRQRGRGERGGKKWGVSGVGVPRGAGVLWAWPRPMDDARQRW
jgi:hypothetical protein